MVCRAIYKSIHFNFIRFWAFSNWLKSMSNPCFLRVLRICSMFRRFWYQRTIRQAFSKQEILWVVIKHQWIGPPWSVEHFFHLHKRQQQQRETLLGANLSVPRIGFEKVMQAYYLTFIVFLNLSQFLSQNVRRFSCGLLDQGFEFIGYWFTRLFGITVSEIDKPFAG